MQLKDLQLKMALRTALIAMMIGVAGLENSYAERVAPETAQRVAATFLRNNGVRSDQLTNISDRAGFSNLYIFNGEPGFVILAADDCVKPILGYSLTDRFVAENMPSNLRWWLQGYNEQIQYAIDNQLRASTEVVQEWVDLAQGRLDVAIWDVVVEPLIETEWGQEHPYNLQCPDGCATGCVATAMAQILKKWNYPLHGIGSHSYIPKDHPEYGSQTANFGETTYDWGNMPNRLDNASQEEIEVVATLMKHCGVSVDMNYGFNGGTESSAFDYKVAYALKAYFGYSEDVEYVERDHYSGDWISRVEGELNAGRPVYYGGESTYYVSNGIIYYYVNENGDIISQGHAFVCDGYNSNHCFHINWGWNGDFQDTYFDLDSLTPGIVHNYNFHQDAIFGIHPSSESGSSCDAPTNLTASVNGHAVSLSWTAAEGVDSYRVYRNGVLRNASVTGTSYNEIDVNGNCHYYLRSNCADGSISLPSNTAEVMIGYNVLIGDLRYSLNEQDLTAEVIGHRYNHSSYGYGGALTIPSTVTYTNQYGQSHNFDVISIGDEAFHDYSHFTGGLSIPNSVTSIGYRAFSGCSGFTGSLTIPNSVTMVGEGAFASCSGFTGSLTIGNHVTTIGEDAFISCSGFTGSLTIPNSVTEIGVWAFKNCSGFSGYLSIPNSVTSIGTQAFAGCSFHGLHIDMTNIPGSASFSDFTGSLTIGNHVTSIGNGAFSGCSGFTGSLTIPSTVTSIGSSAFSGCSGFTGSLTIPSSVTSLGSSAFRDCSGFTGSLTIPNSVTSIGERAFYNCSFNGLNIDLINIPSSEFPNNSWIEHIGGNFSGSLTIGNSTISIGNSAFKNCNGFTGSLTIPNSVTSIGSSAFYNCSGFTGSLTIPNSVTSIGSSAFYNCSGFTGSLTIPNSVTSIGYNAFYNCSGFTGSLTIPNSVTSIGQRAFYGCSFNGLNIDMTNIPAGTTTNYSTTSWLRYIQGNFSGLLTIGNSVTSIGDYAFYSCSDFTGSLIIPNSVTTIGNSAFSGCSGFTGSLTIPNSVTTIGNGAFNGCSGFTGSLTIPNSVTTIGNNAFYGCRGFTGSLTIPNSVTSIGNSAFSGCRGFTGSLTIGNSVTVIGDGAFQGCRGFTGSLTIPNSVTTIGNYAFQGCSGFTGSLTISNSLTTIGNCVFSYCTGFIGSLTIPNSVTSIGEQAFYGCIGFTGNLTIGNSVTSIGNEAFSGYDDVNWNMHSMEFTGDLVIPNSVTTIGERAFFYCSGFTGSLTIGNHVTTIGNSAFSGCSGFTGSLTIGDHVTTIGNYAFSGCSGFTGSLNIPNSVTSIGNHAFYNCSGFVGSLAIGNSVTSIGNSAFYDCIGFTGSLTIPNSVTTIGEAAFCGCSGFTGILTIGNSVTTIGYYAFCDCSGFTGSLTIPNSVSEIGFVAFSNCNGLEQITVESNNENYDSRENCNALIETSTNELILGCKNTIIPNSVTKIGYRAFYNCSGFTGSLTIPNSVTSIGGSALKGCSNMTSIYSYGAVPPATGDNAFEGMNYEIPVYVPLCSTTDYSEAEQWSNFTNYQATLPCQPTFTGNGTDDLWSNPDNWHTLPTNDYDIIINANCEMDEDVEASGIIINNTGTLIVKSGHVLTISSDAGRSGNTLEGEIINHGTAANLIIEDGGQLVYGQVGLPGTVQKNVSPYTFGGSEGWHLISYPLTGIGTVASQENLLSNSYDLYYYDEPTHYWGNYKNVENGFNQLEAGSGYLYANSGVLSPAGIWVGEDTGTTGYFPFYTYYNYSISENLFLASELAEAGLGTNPLGSLCWYATNAPGYEQSGISIWMANVEDVELIQTSHVTNGMTLVYSGSMTPVLGWNEFVFNENTFAWDGVSNLLICVQRNNGAWNSTVRWQSHNAGFTAQSYAYNDDNPYDAATTAYSMSATTDRSNIIFKTVEEIGAMEQTPITLSFAGELENGAATVNVPLSYTETAGRLKGFNLVGNPFVHNVTAYGGTNVADGCFRMNEGKDNLIVSEISETQPLKPAEGFFVKATAEGACVTFNTRSRGETARNGFINLELSENGKIIDRFIVKKDGEPLEKLTLKENGTRLFAKYDNQEMAIISCPGNEQPVSFKAAKNGQYTITVDADDISFNYLQLIDNLTGADIDLLATPSYTFQAKTTDYASRFQLVFSANGEVVGDNEDCIGYVVDGKLFIPNIDGRKTLQIIDMLGRVLCSETVTGSYEKQLDLCKGVYVVRLDDKSQRIVVR